MKTSQKFLHEFFRITFVPPVNVSCVLDVYFFQDLYPFFNILKLVKELHIVAVNLIMNKKKKKCFWLSTFCILFCLLYHFSVLQIGVIQRNFEMLL